MPSQMSAAERACVEECLRCHALCLGMLMRHCLEVGGDHLDPEHVRTMQACAEACRAAAALMLIGSDLHPQMCSLCAQACRDCAESCSGLDGMEECAEVCRRCEERCRAMVAA